MTPDRIIDRLGLVPHPEGGHYRQTWAAPGDGRPLATCIYYLLKRGERSHWHAVDADEIWLWHAGAGLEMRIASQEAGPAETRVLGPDLLAGEDPQIVVAAHHWQSATPKGDFCLVSCVVSPGFTFDGFTLAAPDFDIP